ncbi:MAG: ATP-binding protein [Elusimicrobia bacterium]|nr:ATP-binding protein [Elusimicrobiota bacterium]
MYTRPMVQILRKRLQEKRRTIQVLAGPRQTGKTTIAKQILHLLEFPYVYSAADEPLLKGAHWIEQQWEMARIKVKGPKKKALLILDEIHKIPHWSETTKKLWDEDSFLKLNLQVVLLGSSPLLVEKGLKESLAGRFEIIYVPHWSYQEMRSAFGWDIDKYVFFGGYPGSSSLIADYERWSNYILESLVETSISRDILLMSRVDKPILLRRLFELGCRYSGQILSYQKMLGQLQDAGNTVTLAHYLHLLGQAGLLLGLQKYSAQKLRQRASSPKFQALNTALLSAQMGTPYKETLKRGEDWGRLFESCVGAHMANGIKGKNIELFYWAGFNREVDFLLVKDKIITAIEVKSGRSELNLPGMEFLSKEYKINKKLLVGSGGIPLSEFLSIEPTEWFR